MIGRLVDLSLSLDGKQRLTVELGGNFQDDFLSLRDFSVDIEIKKHREKRSKDANAYFHVLVHKIAEKLGEGNDERKKKIVIESGALARGSDGQIIGLMLPEKIDAEKLWKYVRPYDVKTIKGKKYVCYLVYKETHEMDTREMSRCIDEAVKEAKELGIETATPAELERLKSEWRNYER
jgi:hypothetical protein